MRQIPIRVYIPLMYNLSTMMRAKKNETLSFTLQFSPSLLKEKQHYSFQILLQQGDS